jgi:signal transduction histidine kinase
MPKGGTITIRAKKKILDNIKERVGRREGDFFTLGEEAVIIEVEDTGVGISKENLKRVFDPFFTTKSTKEGTGLGLAVTLNIINEHKGLIEIESKLGKGTKVILTLKTAKNL